MGSEMCIRDRNMEPLENYGIQVMSIGFLVDQDEAMIWRGPMATQALEQLLRQTNWRDLDYLVIDLPPGTGDIHLSLVQAVPLSGAIIVSTPQPVAVADARKGAWMFRTPQVNVPLLGIVENMAFFVPEDLPDRKYFIFGQDGGARLAETLGIPLLGQIPLVEDVRTRGDEGNPSALNLDSPTGKAFAGVAAEVARQVAIRNSQTPPTATVQMQVQ